MKKIQKEWISTKEAADVIGVSSDRLRGWIKSGMLKRGRHYRNISLDKNRPTYRFNPQTIKEIFEL